MLQNILTVLSSIPSGSDFFSALVSELSEHLQCEVAIWQVKSCQVRGQVASEGLVFSTNNWHDIQCNTNLFDCIDQLRTILVSSDVNQLGFSLKSKTLAKYDYVALVPWTSYGRVQSVISLHSANSNFLPHDLEFVHTLLLNASQQAHKSWLRIVNDSYFMLQGDSCAPGVVLGVGVLIEAPISLDEIELMPLKDYTQDVHNLIASVEQIKQDMQSFGSIMSDKLGADKADLFMAYCQMVDRHGLICDITKCMQEQNLCVQSALKVVININVKKFATIDDPYLKSRSIDIKDIGQRILYYLQSKIEAERDYPENSILLGEELTLFDLMAVPQSKLIGVVSGKGSKYSHVGIVAKSLGLPTVTNLQQINISQLDDKTIFVDGYAGRVMVSPIDDQLRQAELKVEADKKFLSKIAALRFEPAKTIDGYAVSLFANVGLGADLQFALMNCAEGIGLFRSEMLFMTYQQLPGLNRQISIYKKLLKSMDPKPVIIRTLDVGGDKALPYLSCQETNPYLGWRGLRFCLDHPEVLQMQMYAMIAASEGLTNLHVLVPMVSSLQEVVKAKKYLDKALFLCRQDGLDVSVPAFGVMIETPVSALQVDSFASVADFFSVGSNDLVQYLLAVDRNNFRVADLFDNFNPVVLKVLQKIVDDSHKNNKHVSVCGELAADPMGAVLLVAMGYDSLSMSAVCLDKIKWVFSKVSLADCQVLLAEALMCKHGEAVSALLKRFFQRNNMGHLVGLVED